MENADRLHRQAQRLRVANRILSRLGLMQRWAKVGEPRLVGAAAYGLMVAPDIDLEIYCEVPSVDRGFAVVGELARQPEVWKVRFSNELDAADHGSTGRSATAPTTRGFGKSTCGCSPTITPALVRSISSSPCGAR